MAKKGCGWEDSRVSMMDLQYHDVNLQKGLYYALERGGYVERVVSYEEIAKAETMPPLDTRAYFRAMCLKKYPKEVYAASWTSVLFDIGNTTIKRVPLMEPLRGTENLTKGLLEESDSVEELLARIKA
jgi:proteasome accessory factor A